MCNYLLKKINEDAKKHNIKYIISEIHKDNALSIKCHERNNFNKTDVLSYEDTYYYIFDLNKFNSVQRTAFVAKFGETVERHFSMNYMG